MVHCFDRDKAGEFNGKTIERRITLKHFKQRYNWDCGLACITMILPEEKRFSFLGNFSDICKTEGFNKSTWTIDLCFILSRYGISYKFTTMTLGVTSSYRSNSFYEKVYGGDEERVNARFAKALDRSYNVQKRRVEVADIVEHLNLGPAIVLTNSRLLTCETCKHNKLSAELRKSLPSYVPYQGHYVVLCGYNTRKGVVYYRNPIFYDHVCCMKFDLFDEARKCYGTDEDTIFIYY